MGIPVLDHGYVSFVESWGSDERVIAAARMSTNAGFKGWGPTHSAECSDYVSKGSPFGSQSCFGGCKPGDEKLLRYLWEHKHATPFEMAGFVVEVQAPIFVFREWHRHRTQSYNELSARYTPLPDVNYIPTVERLLEAAEVTKNKQASALPGIDYISDAGAEQWRAELKALYDHAQQVYDLGLKLGVSKELARLPVPVARYSRMRASANLRNWLAFLTLRMDSAAQYEIREYAHAVGTLVAELFPRTWALFKEGLPCSTSPSSQNSSSP
jgi:thymidylate synthase (FAD)